MADINTIHKTLQREVVIKDQGEYIMTAGITRVHSFAVMPTQRPSTLSFFNVSTSTNLTSTEIGVNAQPNGVFDVMFRTGVTKFATVAVIGTPHWTGSATVLNFAIEDTGTLSDTGQVAGSGLGFGSKDDITTYTSVSDALQAAIRAISTNNYHSYDMSAMVVSPGVVATTNVTL